MTRRPKLHLTDEKKKIIDEVCAEFLTCSIVETSRDIVGTNPPGQDITTLKRREGLTQIEKLL